MWTKSYGTLKSKVKNELICKNAEYDHLKEKLILFLKAKNVPWKKGFNLRLNFALFCLILPWPAFSGNEKTLPTPFRLLERERESAAAAATHGSTALNNVCVCECDPKKTFLPFLDGKYTVILAWMVCFRPEGSTNLQVSSSTEAETTWSRGWFRGKADSRVRISHLRTFMQAILQNTH